MPTLNELGAATKAQYPGQYDDMNDLDVGRRVKAKYPTEYADYTGAGLATPKPERDPNMIMVSAHQRWRPGMKLKKKEPWVVSQLPNALGMAGDVAGRAVGGTLGAAAGVAAGIPTVGTGSLPLGLTGAAVGQQAGGTAGAALGGGTGEGIRQIIDAAMGYGGPDSPETLDERMGAVGEAAGAQAAFSVGGQVLGKVATRGGKALMGAAMKATPEVAQTAIREGITATKAGMEKVGARLGEYGERTVAMLRHSTKQGTKFQPKDILRGGAQALMDDLAKDQLGTAPERLGVFKELAAKFIAGKTTVRVFVARGRIQMSRTIQDMTPLDLHEFKRQAQEIATPLYAKRARNEALNPQEDATLAFYKAMGEFAQQQLERTTPDMTQHATGKVLSLAEANAQTSHLIKLKELLTPIVGKGIGPAAEIAKRSAAPIAVGSTVGAMRPGSPWERFQSGAGGAIVGGAAGSPALRSQVALLLSNPMLAQLLTQAPRAVGVLAEEGR